jgi:HD-GYP domain-containing protein (c-di-GMP phosphodiesterase class II)
LIPAFLIEDPAAATRQARIAAAFDDSAIGSSAALHALMTTLYRKVPDALAHVQAVADEAGQVGVQLGLDERDLGHLDRAAWAHELGKLVLPDLDDQRDRDAAPGEPTPRWSQQIVVAAEILSNTPFLRPAAELVLASRESIDGTGYPLRITGAAIPMGARILHVADAFDALSAVCASFGITLDAAYTELERNAGSRFDPVVVAACVRCSESAGRRGFVAC